MIFLVQYFTFLPKVIIINSLGTNIWDLNGINFLVLISMIHVAYHSEHQSNKKDPGSQPACEFNEPILILTYMATDCF